ncbi:MAG: kynureninase, partial [Phenylobacterium sp.]|nr:kynureninase [Phenylobacterium sp.]
MTRDEALALDRADPLASRRDLFELEEGLIYLDGNSRGALPKAVKGRLAQAVVAEWGRGLIRSWNSAG